MSRKRLFLYSSIFLAGIIGMALYGIMMSPSSPPPPLPVWTDRTARWSVAKTKANFMLKYSTAHGARVFYVGKSPVELQPFVGKEVSLKGTFPMTTNEQLSDIQCIVEKCHPIFTKMPWEAQHQKTSVIDITEIHLKK